MLIYKILFKSQEKFCRKTNGSAFGGKETRFFEKTWFLLNL